MEVFKIGVLTAIVLVAEYANGQVVDNGLLSETRNYSFGDVRTCLMDPSFQSLILYEVLPGHGWDNLLNQDTGLLVNHTFSKCKTTDDGRYLLPDNIIAIPVKRSKIETFAELFSHWSSYTSTTSSSINAAANIGSVVSGSFSEEFKKVKINQIGSNSVTTRVQARYIRYVASLEPETPLNSKFKERLSRISTNIELGKLEMATYESQLLVRDYGTHIITRMDAGAVIVQTEEIKSTFTKNYGYNENGILASASASFGHVVNMSFSYGHVASDELINQYLGNRTHSNIETHGGPAYKPNDFSLNEWTEKIRNDLVAVDRAGDPIYYLINPYTLPELSPSSLYDLRENVKSAVEEYYNFNTYRGCTKSESPNFSFVANVDDGSCESAYENYTFGGVYQTCQYSGYIPEKDPCQDISQMNPLTGYLSCPYGYEAVLLNKGSFTVSSKIEVCKTHFLIFKKCRYETEWTYVSYSPYWCVATTPVTQPSGFQFGGVYTSTLSNLRIKSRGCPLYYYPLRLGKDLKVCVSDDYELGYQYSVPFAGFFSCSAGNPLTFNKKTEQSLKPEMSKVVHSINSYLQIAASEHWPKGCPEGFSSHLATVEQGCEISYCVKANAFSDLGLPALRKPPYIELPKTAYLEKGIIYEFDIKGNGQWAESDFANISSPFSVNDKSKEGNGSVVSVGVTVAVSVSTFVFGLLVCTLVKRKKICQISSPERGPILEGCSNANV